MTSLPAEFGVPLGYRFVQPTPNVVEHPKTQSHDVTIAYSASCERHRTSRNAREQPASWRSVQLRSRRLQVRALSGAPNGQQLSETGPPDPLAGTNTRQVLRHMVAFHALNRVLRSFQPRRHHVRGESRGASDKQRSRDLSLGHRRRQVHVAPPPSATF